MNGIARISRWIRRGLCIVGSGGAVLLGAESSPAPPPATNAVANASTATNEQAVLKELFARKENTTNTLGMVMVWVPAGYRVGQCEVTQQQFEELVGSNPSRSIAPQQPVEQVSWNEAVEFCRRLTDKEQAEGKLPKGYDYALPTEAQWEQFVDNASVKDAIVSIVGDRRQPMPVGLLPANDYGLHDVRGNVWEWCSSPVARGASYMSHEDYLELSFRYVGTPELKFADIGFRCVLVGGDSAPAN